MTRAMERAVMQEAKNQGRGGKSGRRRVAILGATGSIGCGAIEVCRHLAERFEIRSLTAVTSWKKLAEQALEVHPAMVALNDKSTQEAPSENLRALRDAVLGTPIKLVTGPNAMAEIARAGGRGHRGGGGGRGGGAGAGDCGGAGREDDCPGEQGSAGGGGVHRDAGGQEARGGRSCRWIRNIRRFSRACGRGEAKEIRKIILTASGGPFRTWTKAQIENATVAEALAHPNWKMGPKITIDSATMMNKALEIIEAHWLFDLPAEKIEVLIHPQSIVHSMIEFVDGSVIAQLGTPDMRTPIQYALTHPERVNGCSSRLEWSKIREMTFEMPDERFPALQLGYEVVRLGGTCGAVVNAANEAANEMFRAGNIRFGEIVQRVQAVLARHLSGSQKAPTGVSSPSRHWKNCSRPTPGPASKRPTNR